MIQKIDKLRYLQIGVQGENIANDIQIDVSEWVEAYPGASIHLLFKPYNAVAPSPMTISVEDGILTWQPSLGATVVTGVGYTEVRAIDPEAGMIKKSRIIPTAVENSVSGVDSEDPPAPFEDWVNNVLQASEDAVNAKTVATAAKEAAEAARDAAQAAAGDFQGLSAEVETLTPGSDATIDVTHEEGGLYNFAFGIPKGEKGDKGDTGDPAPSDQVVPAVDDWLDDHITNPSNPPLDTSLSLSTAAAPANLVGELKSAIPYTANGYITVFPSWEKGTIDKYGADQTDNNRYRTVGYLDAETGVKYTFSGKNNNTPIVRWYDSNNVYKTSTTNFTPDASGNSSVTLEAPWPKYRVVINTSNPTNYPTAIGNVGIIYESELYERVSDLESEDIEINERIDDIENGLLNGLIPISVEWEQGTINAQGEEESANNLYRTEDYIETRVGDIYVISSSMSNGFVVRWYNSEKEFEKTSGSKTAVSGETQTNEIQAEYPYCRIVNNSADNANYPAAPGNVVIGNQINSGMNKANYYKTLFGEKTVDCLGDSFTYDLGWRGDIEQKTGWAMNGYGVISSRISKDFTRDGVTIESFLHRYDEMDTSADAVIIFGGINDCVFLNNGTITMGDMTSTLDDNTFYGALRLLIESIHDSTFMPDKRIMGVIPPDFEQDAAHLTWLPQVQAAEREIYSYYGIPYVDLKKDCQEMYESEYNLGKYRLVSGTRENYHPSADGYKAISNVILNGLVDLFR